MKRLKWENVISIIIPLAILLYVLYWNFLPFGYEQTFVLDVGADSDTDCSNPICITDLGGLGVEQKIGDLTWRDFVSNKLVKLKINSDLFNDEIIFENTTVNFNGDQLEYYKLFNEDLNLGYWVPLHNNNIMNLMNLQYNPSDSVIGVPYLIKVNKDKLALECDITTGLNASSNYANYDLHLNGLHKFLIYFPNGVRINSTEKANFKLWKIENEVITFNHTYVNNSQSGYFWLEADGRIKSLGLNSNKFIILDELYQTSWNSFNLLNKQDQTITLYSDVDQKVSFSNIPMINLGKGYYEKIRLPKNSYDFNVERGFLSTSGFDFASISRETIFDPQNYFACLNHTSDTGLTLSEIPNSSSVYLMVDDVKYSELLNITDYSNQISTNLGKLDPHRSVEYYSFFDDYLNFSVNLSSVNPVKLYVLDIDGNIIHEDAINDTYSLKLEGLNLNLYKFYLKSDSNFQVYNASANSNKFCYKSGNVYSGLRCNFNPFIFEFTSNNPDYVVEGKKAIPYIRANNGTLFNLEVIQKSYPLD